ncbi:uncharacterized protein [Zea mays]|uniref:uncharacterized protein n=1 Tax=Zea mays TaxID=4577 RepID=UPI0004DE7C0F|nr:uncharacterized protein LOC118476306 [Zea mays]
MARELRRREQGASWPGTRERGAQAPGHAARREMGTCTEHGARRREERATAGRNSGRERSCWAEGAMEGPWRGRIWSNARQRSSSTECELGGRSWRGGREADEQEAKRQRRWLGKKAQSGGRFFNHTQRPDG